MPFNTPYYYPPAAGGRYAIATKETGVAKDGGEGRKKEVPPSKGRIYGFSLEWKSPTASHWGEGEGITSQCPLERGKAWTHLLGKVSYFFWMDCRYIRWKVHLHGKEKSKIHLNEEGGGPASIGAAEGGVEKERSILFLLRGW